MHTPTVAPQLSEDRKPVKVKVGGAEHIQLVTIADRFGFTVEGLLSYIVANGCTKLEKLSKEDFLGLLFGGDIENGAS